MANSQTGKNFFYPTYLDLDLYTVEWQTGDRTTRGSACNPQAREKVSPQSRLVTDYLILIIIGRHVPRLSSTQEYSSLCKLYGIKW